MHTIARSYNKLHLGFREGELIKGMSNASALGTLVERTSILLELLKLLKLLNLLHFIPASAVNVLKALKDKLSAIAQHLRKTFTYNQDKW